MHETVPAMAQVLCIWDFDHSLIEDNSDIVVVDELAPDLRALMREYTKEHTHSWTVLMGLVFEKIHQRGVTIDQLAQSIRGLRVDPGVVEAMTWMHYHNVDIRIVSDANTFFIDTFLKAHGWDSWVSHIVTNPSHVAPEGCLVIEPFVPTSLPHGCPLCQPNICKGAIVEPWVREAAWARVLYVGDGRGDLCPCLRLHRPQGVALARAECSLSKLLAEREARGDPGLPIIRAWHNGHELSSLIQEFFFAKETLQV
eukprot:gnl/Trimastix_PCT/3361.p1 GENE.gnl/Trimastix_PCT/3361~~gnl/Trimastix_PCT/3361.p1  ORF type:complete len:255 (-),score=31.21 gnl/Trimastix_PCT/3361:231-995(-)